MRPIGILGFGEVGQALKEHYDESFFGKVLIKDLDRDEFEKGLEVLNVCVPYSDNFNSVVIETIDKYEPRLTIIHSTVPPYTTKAIRDAVGKKPVVHSPHRGVHPHLAPSFKKFVKYVGAESKSDGMLAKEHFKWLFRIQNKRILVYRPAKITEFNKLLSTTYYGLCIAFTDYVNKLFQRYKIPFFTFNNFNRTYNKGYKAMGRENVIRPTLYPPEEDGLKSHCIIENCVLLFPYSKDKRLLESVLALGKNPSAIKGKKHLDKSWLFAEYWGKGKSGIAIGKEVGTIGNNIIQIMKRRGIPRRPSRNPLKNQN